MDIPTRICMIHIYIMSLPSFEGLSCLCLHSASRNQKTKIATKPTRIWNPVSRERSRISQAHRKQWASLPVTSETTGERSLDPSVCRLDELARLLLPPRMLGETHAVGITGASFRSKGKREWGVVLCKQLDVIDVGLRLSLFWELVHCHSSNFSLENIAFFKK